MRSPRSFERTYPSRLVDGDFWPIAEVGFDSLSPRAERGTTHIYPAPPPQGVWRAADNLPYSQIRQRWRSPPASDLYECELYSGRQCRVVSVSNAQVTFRWVGDYARIEPQIVPVNRFVVDFKLIDASR